MLVQVTTPLTTNTMIAVMITGKMYLALSSIPNPRPLRCHHRRKRVIQQPQCPFAAEYWMARWSLPPT
jgi:hypothetical protein